MTDEEVLEARGEAGLEKHRKQRAERGWSDFDLWSGSTYLAKVIGSMALAYRDRGSGYPANMGEEEWYIILNRIGKPLLAYAQGIDIANFGDSQNLHEEAQDALRLFADFFEDFWD